MHKHFISVSQGSLHLTENKNCQNMYDPSQLVENAEIEFLDQADNMMTEQQLRNDYHCENINKSIIM